MASPTATPSFLHPPPPADSSFLERMLLSFMMLVVMSWQNPQNRHTHREEWELLSLALKENGS